MLQRIRRLLVGPPRDVKDPHTFHSVSLVALLAWVGLGADGLSSSAYGPDEAFRALGTHTSFAAILALATALTVFIISYGYSRIIEQFPTGGGGYVVASKLLGPRFGVISGAALLVDYVLTISVSIASGADAVFSFLRPEWQSAKLPSEVVALAVLTVLNLRGVKESITALLPIFLAFLITHTILLLAAIGVHLGDIPTVAMGVRSNFHESVAALGTMGALKLAVRAYSLGGGTYTGIEAVSNGVGIMREPRVPTAKRTMGLMAVSLSVTAGGILLSYLLAGATPRENMTMNAVLLDRVFGAFTVGGLRVGHGFSIFALITEGALLFVAAQAGFVDGPRVMANMAIDSWLPHRFAALSERLSMQNGVLLMGGAGVATLLYTQGSVGRLVVMYSINVFATFSLSNLGMSRFWISNRERHRDWWRHLPVHLIGLALCLTILAVTVVEKFSEGGWLTVAVTSALVLLCTAIRAHYQRVGRAIRELDTVLPDSVANEPVAEGEVPREAPVAVFFVGGYNGLGRHAVLKLLAMFPGHFKGAIFVSVAVIDSGVFKGADEVESLQVRAREALDRYVDFSRRLGVPASSECRVGTEVPATSEAIAREVLSRHPRAIFVSGKLLFETDNLFTRPLHNETAFAVQSRLQRSGIPMVVLPVRVTLGSVPSIAM